ncbi:MAG: TIGR04255 family protein [Syntrophobacteraceae bacterium]
MKIMDKFPESSLIFQRGLLLALNPDKIEDLPKIPQEQGNKLWQFRNPQLGYTLNVASNSLTISSTSHKTYNKQQSENRFRDFISHVLTPFFHLTNLPILNRIGLRYIDECPFSDNTTASFCEHFNSCLPIGRFPIEKSVEQQYVAFVKHNEYFLRYVETYNAQIDSKSLTLDFDGSANDVPAKECLAVTDKLHDIIEEAYFATIKDPVFKYMRGDGEDGH